MTNIKISGYADEISSDFKTQLKALKKLNMNHIALRTINGVSVFDYPYDRFKEEIYPLLKSYNISVSEIGSPIGKVHVDDEISKKKQIDKIDNLIKIMKLLDTKYLRVFSLYIKEHNDQTFHKVITFLNEVIAKVEGHDLIVLHENEKDIYGDQAVFCKQIHEHIKHKQFKAIFDFANFVQVHDDTKQAYSLLKPYIYGFHIKDADETGRNVLIGEGEGYLSDILSQIDFHRFKGYVTLEPHLVDFDSLKSLEKDHKGKKSTLSPYHAFHNTLDALYKMLNLDK